MSVKIKFDTREFERAIAKIGAQRTGEIMATAAYQAGEVVADTIKRRAPDSGISRNSPRKKQKKKLYPGKLSQDVMVKEARIDYRGVLVRVLSLPYYTGMVERGTSKQSPNPYVRQSAKTAEPKAQEIMSEGVRKMVEEAFR